MSDATGTNTQHPALVTATGTAAPPGHDATGTHTQHPAIVTRPGKPTA